MTRLRDRKERAYQVPAEIPPELKTATLSVRPLRLAFLVDAQASREELLKYITYNTSIWGGGANYFVPVHDSGIRENWWRVLENIDPDKVICCLDLEEELLREISDRIQPFFMWKWSDNIAENHKYGLDGVGSVPLRYVLRHIHKQSRPIQQSRVRIPQCPNDPTFCFCAASQFGYLAEDLGDIYTQLLKAEAVNCGNRSLAEYLVVVSQLEGWLVPLDMTTWELSSQVAGFGGPLGLIIVILGDSATAEDFCVFWNLRASQPLLLSKGPPLLLPASAFDSEGTLQFLAEWCINRTERTNSLILVSASLNAQELATIKDRFKPLLQDQFLVDLWYRNFSFSKVQRYESRHKEEIRVTGRTLNIRPPRPGWWDQSQTGMEWVIDLDLRSHPLVGDGYIPPKYPKLNHVLAGEPELEYVKFGRGYLIRSSGECLSLRVGKTNDFLQITLPDDDRLFRSLLRSKGCGSVITEKSRYARGMLRLLGGYQEVQIFRESGVRDLFNVMKGGSCLTRSEMNASLEPGGKASKHQDIDRLVAELALKGVFLRGYQLRCPACDLQRWYSLQDVAETMQCVGCLTRIQPPIEAPFCYRLNELFVKGLIQGSMSLLLSLLLLSKLSRDSFLCVPGIQVTTDNNPVDIDILAACDGHLVAVESKDLQAGCSSDMVAETFEQLGSVVKTAEEIEIPIVILSSLLDALPEELSQGIQSLRQQHPTVAIHSALRTDLERGSIIPQGRDKPVSLSDLFPVSETKPNGWIREPGKKIVSF